MTRAIVEELLRKHHTPAFVFDLDTLAIRAQKIASCLKREGIEVCYAMKANPFLVLAILPFVGRIEVCSPGEFRICEREDIGVDRLVISGVNKEIKEMKRITRQYGGRGVFTIESSRHMEQLLECARESNCQLSALIRITSGNQFGIEPEAAKEMLARREEYPELKFLGIQYYSGTQKKKMSIIEKELKMLDEFCREVKENLQFVIEEIEYGPGFYVPYFQSEEEKELEDYLEEFNRLIQNMEFTGKVTLELGRFLAAECGSYLTAIVDRKENAGQIFGIVDGGIHHLNYYGQAMAMKLPHVTHLPGNIREAESKPIEKWNICGSLCTTADVIVKQLPLQGAQVGDVLVFERTGAYSVTEGISLFLSRDLPLVLSYSKKDGVQLLRDEQPTDGLNSK